MTIRSIKTLSVLAVFASFAAAHAFSFNSTTYNAGSRPDSVAAGDFDRDGDLDLALTVDAPDRVQIFRNTGGGSYAAPVDLILGSAVGAGAIGALDADGDGDLDLAISLHNANSVVLALNNGAGVFSVGPSAPTGLNPVGIAVGDVNGDGRADVLTANRDGNSVSVLLNTGGAFSSSSFAVGAEPRTVALGDLDGDGDLDVAVSSHRDRVLSTFRNAGNGTFGTRQDYSVAGQRPQGVVIVNLDGDADLDVAATADNNGVGFVGVFLNNGTGTLSSNGTFLTGGQNPGFLVAGDYDQDGDRDLAAANEDTNTLALLSNAGNATFAAPELLATGAFPNGVGSADLDADGDLDLATANRDSNTMTVFLNAVGAPFITPTRFVVERGVLSSGGLSDLFNADDLRVNITQRVPFSAADANARLLVEGVSSVQSPSELRFRFEGSTSASPAGAVRQRIELFDWTTNQWFLVDDRNATGADSAVNVSITTNAGRFVQAGTGLMQARIGWFDRGVIGLGWGSRTDQTVWQVIP